MVHLSQLRAVDPSSQLRGDAPSGRSHHLRRQLSVHEGTQGHCGWRLLCLGLLGKGKIDSGSSE